MTIKLNKTNINTIIVFLILFLSVSFVVTNNILSNLMTIALWLIVFALSLYFGKGKLSKSVLGIVALMISLMFITDILRGEDLVANAKLFVSILIVALFVCYVPFQEFAHSYIKVMKFLAVISIVGYIIHLVIPGVFSLFNVKNSSGFTFSNWILYIQYIGNGSNSFRNWGFAWEPGAFSTFICLSLMLEIFLPDSKVTLKSLLIYMIAVITTFSTTGIVAFFCLCIYLLVVDRKISKKIKHSIIAVLVLIILCIVLLQDFFFDTNTSSVFGKLINLINGSSSGQLTSSSIRINGITKVFRSFLQSPLIGWGYNGLITETFEFTRGMNTCTFVNWFAVYGILFGFVMTGGMYRLSSFLGTGTLRKIVLFIFFFGITMTENYVHCPFWFMLVLYGYTTPIINNRNHNKLDMGNKVG